MMEGVVAGAASTGEGLRASFTIGVAAARESKAPKVSCVQSISYRLTPRLKVKEKLTKALNCILMKYGRLDETARRVTWLLLESKVVDAKRVMLRKKVRIDCQFISSAQS